MHSLRSRVIIGGSVWAVLIVLVGGFALFSFFANATQRRFDADLLDKHLQLVVALNNSAGDPQLITTFLSEPAYDRPYSGTYWQAAGPDGIYLSSRSLFDAFLPDPENPGPTREFWEGDGPTGTVRGVHQYVEIADGSEWVVEVARDLDSLQAEQRQIQQSLFSTLGLIGVMGVIAAVLMTSLILRPLARLREDVSHRWDEGQALSAADYPEEVAPLVTDINTLLARNREIVDRARRQAADMAHALKTPSAILRNELEILGMEGVKVEQAQDALHRIDAQLLRSLARIRAANTGVGIAERVKIDKSVERLARLFRSMHEPEGKELQTEISQGLAVPMDVQDIEEVIGNLLENAFKYCKKTVRVTARRREPNAEIRIEDDGPGIPEAGRVEAMRSGGRLDTSKPGTGLGLAIAIDLLRAYGGDLELSASDDLGGLCVICKIPLRPITPDRLAASAG